MPDIAFALQKKSSSKPHIAAAAALGSASSHAFAADRPLPPDIPEPEPAAECRDSDTV